MGEHWTSPRGGEVQFRIVCFWRSATLLGSGKWPQVSAATVRRIETIQRSVGPGWGSLSSESSRLPHFKRSNSNLVYFIIWGEKNIRESKVWETALWVWCSDLQMDVWKAQKGHGICWKSSVVISELRLESGTQCSASPLPGQSWEGKRWCTHRSRKCHIYPKPE